MSYLLSCVVNLAYTCEKFCNIDLRIFLINLFQVMSFPVIGLNANANTMESISVRSILGLL